MKVLYYDKKRNPIVEKECKGKQVTMSRLLKESDYISVHIPLNKETYHLISEKEIECMKKTVILINTSRGAIIDEMALADALRKNVIAGAGLDVYEREPSITRKLLNLGNVVLTPHIGSASYETRAKMAVMATQSIIDVLRGKIPSNIVSTS